MLWLILPAVVVLIGGGRMVFWLHRQSARSQMREVQARENAKTLRRVQLQAKRTEAMPGRFQRDLEAIRRGGHSE